LNYQRLYEYRFRDVAQDSRRAVWEEVAPYVHERLGRPDRVLDPAAGRGEFINGSRLVYKMEDEAMRFLNLIANKVFSITFTWLLSQRITDTLCGTKVMRRSDYQKLKAGRSYFGDFDPFGDFDLIFGAAKQNLKIIETPIHYKARTFGETQISRFRDGWLLLKMVWFAYRKLKAI